MRLREKEFLDARLQMLPALFKKFHTYVKLARVQKGRIQYVEDLVQETIAQAYRNAMNPMHDHLPCIDLIKLKSKNIWVDDWRQRKRSLPDSNVDLQQLEWKETDLPEKEINKPIKFERLMEMANATTKDILNKRLEGYSVNDIAAMYGCSPTAISMHMQRLKIKFLAGNN